MSDQTTAEKNDTTPEDTLRPRLNMLELPPELSRLLARAISERRGERGDPTEARLPNAKQAALLKDRLARYNQPANVSPGDIVQFKDGLGGIDVDKRDSLVFIFWRYLDFAEPGDVLRMKTEAKKVGRSVRADCVLAYVCEDGECTVFLTADSAELEPRTIAAEG